MSKILLVTGASRGIGAATARLAADQGYDVCVNYASKADEAEAVADYVRSKGQRAITSFNRNWQNRMGYGGEGFLASPAVVAASALLGYMAPPSELEIDWDPATFA